MPNTTNATTSIDKHPGNRVIKKSADGKNVMLSFDSQRKVADSLKVGREQEKGKFNEDFANSMSDLIKSIKLKAYS